MPNNMFGNPFNVPQVQTSIKSSLPKLGASLGALIKIQQVEAAAAARAARAAAGGGRGRMPQEGDPRYGRYVMVPQKNGTKKPTWVWGTSQKERDAAEAKVVGEATQAILTGDTELQKDLANFESLSVPGRKEVLDRVRQQHAPRLAQTLGISGEELSKQLTTGLEQSIRAREKEIDKAGLGTQLVQAGKQVFRNIKDAIGAIGETPQQQLARGKASAEAAAQDIRENAFQDEIQRLEAEGRGSLGFQLSNPLRSAAMHATPLAAMIAPAIAGGAIAGPAGAIIGGAAGAGLPARGETLSRVATDPNLTEQQKEESIGQTALASGLTAGAIGAIPIGPMTLARPALTRAAINRSIAKKGVPSAVAERMAPGATQAQLDAATREWVNQQAGTVFRPGPYTPNLYQQVGMHGVNAAALGGAFQIGSNAAYGLGTGQDVPLTEGLGEAVMSGAVLGLPFGVGGRIGAAFRGRRVGPDMNFRPDFSQQPGTIQGEYIDTSKPEAEVHPIHELYRTNEQGLYAPARENAAPYTPPDSWQRMMSGVQRQAQENDAAWQNMMNNVRSDLAPYRQSRVNANLSSVWDNLSPRRQSVTPEDVRAAQQKSVEAELRRQTLFNNPVDNPAPRQNVEVKSERSLQERGGEPLFGPRAPTGSNQEFVDTLLRTGDADRLPLMKARIRGFASNIGRNTKELLELALENRVITPAIARDLLADYPAKNVRVKLGKPVIDEWEKNNGNRTAAPVSVEDEQTASVEPAKPAGAGGTDTADFAANSTVPGDTPPVTPAATSADIAETPPGSPAVEGGGDVRSPAPDTGQVETPPANPVEQGTGGAESPVGKSGLEPAAPLNAEGGKGAGKHELAPKQRTRNAGNATKANAELVEEAEIGSPTQEAPLPDATPEQVHRRLTGYENLPKEPKPPMGMEEIGRSVKKAPEFTSIIAEKLKAKELTPEEVRAYIATAKTKWQKAGAEKALERYDAPQTLPDTLAGMDKAQIKTAKELVRGEARTALLANGAPEYWVDDTLTKGNWEEIKNTLLASQTRLSDKTQKYLDELAAPVAEKRRALREQERLQEREGLPELEETVATGKSAAKLPADNGKPFTEKTYAIAKKNLTPLLVERLKRLNRTENEARDFIERDDWYGIRELLNQGRQLAGLENRLQRLQAYAERDNNISLANLDLGIEKIEKAVQAAVKDPTPEKLEAAKQAIDSADPALEKVQNARTVLEEHAKPESEPVSEEYTALQDEKLIPRRRPNQRAKRLEALSSDENTPQAVVRSALEKSTDPSELWAAVFRDPRSPLYEHDTHPEKQKALYEKIVQEFRNARDRDIQSGAYQSTYDLWHGSLYTHEIESAKSVANAELLTKQHLLHSRGAASRDVKALLTRLSPGTYGRAGAQLALNDFRIRPDSYTRTGGAPIGVYAQQISNLWDELNTKMKKAPPQTEATENTFIKAALGMELTKKEQALYKSAIKQGVHPLALNKEAIEKAVQIAHERGFENYTEIDAVKQMPSESAEELNTKIWC